MKKTYQGKHLRRLAAAVCGALVAGTFTLLPNAEALRGGVAMPILDAKDAAVSIATTDNVTMNITSGELNNLIKWVDFSIGAGGKVAFDGNNYLNYVTGSARSDILGTLTGGGSIYLVNPNGILIGDGAIVDVGSLHLSTKNLDVSQLTDYDKGLNLLTSATAAGDVINMGRLNADVISVEGKNITFKNVEDVTSGATLGDDGTLAGGTPNNNVTLTANSTGEIHIGSAEGGASGYTTNGTTYNYKLVSTKEDLQNMKNNLAGNYMLAKDIDMSGVDNFTPIGNSTSFTGKFDGLGHTLSNLVINKENGNNIGVFGIVGSGSVIENLKLSGGNIKGRSCVGLVGYNLGTVRRVYNDGVAVEGRTSVGGIVGENQGMVTQVWNKGAVSGTTQVGGIVGLNNGGTVEVAYNAGSVNGIAGRYTIGYIGGIVGQNVNGSVENVYNTGNVSAANGLNIGGIVGSNTASAGKTATVSYAYNTGDVSAENGSNVNGIVGENYATVDYVYDKPNNATVFNGWTIDKDGTNSTAVWRQYGNNLPLLTAFLTRKDNITSTTEYNGSADVGATYTATTYSGTEAQNGYNYIKDVSIVTPKDLTVSFGASPAKTYDGTTEATAGTATLDGIVNSDAVSLADGVTANFADKNVGENKMVNYTGLALTGDKAKNYNLVNAATATGAGTITRRPLSLTADPVSITQGTAIPASFSGTLTGFAEGESLAEGDSYAFNLSGTPTAVGKYAITGTLSIGGGDPAESGDYGTNYTFANAAANATAFTIAAKYVPPAPGGGGSSGSSGSSASGTSGGATPAAPITPVNPMPAVPVSGGATPAAPITPVNPMPAVPVSGGTTPAATATPVNPAPAAPVPGGNATPASPGATPGSNDGNGSGTSGGATPAATATPVNPASAAPVSGGNATPASPGAAPGSNGGNGSGINTLIAAGTEAAPLLLATVTETEHIAAAAAAGARAEMSQAAAEAAVSGTGTAAPRPAESAAAAAPQGLTWTAEGLIAVANDVNPAPQDALSPQSLGHALSALQHGSGEEQTPSEKGGAKGLEEAIEAADLAIGTEIAETDREGKAGQENLARDNGSSDGEQEMAEEKD